MAPERYFDSDPDSSVASDDVEKLPIPPKSSFLNVTSSAFCHLVILLLLSVGAMFISPSHVPERRLAKGSMQSLETYEKFTVDNSLELDTPYKGEPTVQIEQAWDDLLKYRNIALDLEGVGSDVTINNSGGKTLANLDVFYNLHCLNFIRKYIFKDDYPMSFPPNGRKSQKEYVIQCIDVIRQSLICHGDLAIHTYSWEDIQLVPYPNFKVEHECKNWAAIMDWTKQHHAPKLTGSALVHPMFGHVYPQTD